MALPTTQAFPSSWRLPQAQVFVFFASFSDSRWSSSVRTEDLFYLLLSDSGIEGEAQKYVCDLGGGTLFRSVRDQGAGQ